VKMQGTHTKKTLLMRDKNETKITCNQCRKTGHNFAVQLWFWFHCIAHCRCILYFLLRDADMHSTYLLRRRGLLAGCPSHAGIVSKRL